MTARHALSLAATAAAAFALAAPASAREVCTHWSLGNRFTVHQSNGWQTEFDGNQQGNDLRGTASTFHAAARSTMTGSTATVQKGTFDGKVRGHEVTISVYWSPSSVGVYSGKIGDRGRIEGNTHDRQHPESMATWYADELATCTRHENIQPK